METTQWYVIESSHAEADDWVRHTAETYDNVETARRLARQPHPGFELRVVKVTHIEEVVQ